MCIKRVGGRSPSRLVTPDCSSRSQDLSSSVRSWREPQDMISDWGTYDILPNAAGVSRVYFLRPDLAFPQHEQPNHFLSLRLSSKLGDSVGQQGHGKSPPSPTVQDFWGGCEFVAEAEGWCLLQAAFEPQADTQYSPGAFLPAS